MAEHIQHVKRWHSDPGSNSVQTSEVTERDDPVAEQVHTQNVATRVVWYIADILLALLALRFILALLGANPGNAFANLIYSVTYPFVEPFFSLFRYNLSYSMAHFELYTLVAMLVYVLVAYGITRLLNLSRDDEPN
jgi:uncharacterized protein YggT (Ycf19 family)